LFAQASEIPASTSSGETIIARENKQKKEKNRKRKRQQKSNQNDDDDDGKEKAHQSMLDSRMAPRPLDKQRSSSSSSWPSWITIGSHLYYQEKNKCAGWNSDDAGLTHRCQNCGQSALHHRIQVVVSESSTSSQKKEGCHFEMLVALRNIRCCAKILVLSDKENSGEKICVDKTLLYRYSNALIKTIRDESQRLFTLGSMLRSQLSPEEYSLLESKIQEVGRYPRLLLLSTERPGMKEKKLH
jgi:hypothetical protein